MLTPEVRKAILDQAQEVFFEAMMDGYAGNLENSTKTVDSEGYKTITFVHGDFKVVDRYCVTPNSDFSAGTTTIFYKPEDRWTPVWWMSYGGRYPFYLIHFLKSALRATYEKKEFCGGRGPKFFRGFGESYENNWEGDFYFFSGKEEIHTCLGRGMGGHQYFGMALI